MTHPVIEAIFTLESRREDLPVDSERHIIVMLIVAVLLLKRLTGPDISGDVRNVRRV